MARKRYRRRKRDPDPPLGLPRIGVMWWISHGQVDTGKRQREQQERKRLEGADPGRRITLSELLEDMGL